MAKFTLAMHCDNAAFADNPFEEIDRILASFSRQIADISLDPDSPTSGGIYDLNGSLVGGWNFDPEKGKSE